MRRPLSSLGQSPCNNVEQIYVQFVKLAQPKAKVPILFRHGGGLTGVTWETMPDGKPG